MEGRLGVDLYREWLSGAAGLVPVPFFGNSALFMTRDPASTTSHSAESPRAASGGGANRVGAGARFFSRCWRGACPCCPDPFARLKRATAARLSRWVR